MARELRTATVDGGPVLIAGRTILSAEDIEREIAGLTQSITDARARRTMLQGKLAELNAMPIPAEV